MQKNLRSYRESFEPEKAEVIGRIIEDLVVIGEPPTGYRLYTSEIQSCLSVGLLLAALSVSASLLDLFVRDLTVAARIQSKFEGNMRLRGEVERQVEEEKSLRFDQMLDELITTVILPKDVGCLRQFYATKRIPLVHGLVRRLAADGFMPESWLDMAPVLARGNALEDRLEDTAIGDMLFVVGMMKTYRPWLVRRYNF